MSQPMLSRQLVQQLSASGEVDVLGVLIHVQGDDAWIAKMPELRPDAVQKNETGGQSERVRMYWQRPRMVSYSQLMESSAREDFPRIQFVAEQACALWTLSEAQFDGTMGLPLGLKLPVKKLSSWRDKRDSSFLLIKPIVENKTLVELLYDTSLDQQIRALAEGTGVSKSWLWSLLNRYMFAGARECGLLPMSFKRGAPGRKRVMTKPCGPGDKAYRMKSSQHRGFVMTERDRINCFLAWTKFKKPGVSVHAAYIQMLRTYYAQAVEYVSPRKRNVTLLPREDYPTEGQFAYHGRMGDPTRAPALIGLSSKSFKNNVVGHRGTAQSGVKDALQVGVIDSTSSDQTLASESSTLLMLAVPRTTRIMDVRTEYILGESRRSSLSAV